jgi:LuxR family maltose regulon positive regulatory protein
MSCRTPLVARGQLHVAGSADAIGLETLAWYAWLSDDRHHSFHFKHPIGDFTARKERKQRGQGYWVAYRQVQGKLYKTYLGKSEALTEAHLCAGAQALARASAQHAARCARDTGAEHIE